MPEHEVLTPEEVAEYLRLDPQTVYRQLRQGKLPGAKLGNQWRIDRRVLDEYLYGTGFQKADGEPLSPEDLAAIQRGLDEIKAGRMKSWDALRRELDE